MPFFEGLCLAEEYLDISVIHGDGTTTAAKKAATTSDSVGWHFKG